tara:strand:+ start:447 stop:1025 length:579 start_codon:yes stop_codon:yes gene_type:complete
VELQKRLLAVQTELHAPKNQRNNFGKYNYRNCEDILEALKPLLLKHELNLTLTDHVTEVAGVLIIDARATVSYKDKDIIVSAAAGVDLNRKGMDIAQSFGSSSSYARKYALNGLFLIDDTKDADATNDHKGKAKAKPTLSKDSAQYIKALEFVAGGGDLSTIEKKYTLAAGVKDSLEAVIEKEIELLTNTNK